MIPIRDSVPSSRTPIVMRTILGANIVIFLVELLFMAGDNLESLFNVFAINPAREVASFQAVLGGNLAALPVLLLPCITAMFLHGGIFHILGNMFFLWVFGDNVEDIMGHWRFLSFYLLCGLGATAIQIASDPTSTVPNLGASGAIAGVLGAYLINFPRSRVDAILPLGFLWIPIQLPAMFYLGFWFVQQAFFSLLSFGAMESSGIAFWAHSGGFIVGVALVKVFAVRKGRYALF